MMANVKNNPVLLIVPALAVTAMLAISGCKTHDACCNPDSAPASTQPKTTSQSAPTAGKLLTDPATGTTVLVGNATINDKETGEVKTFIPTAVTAPAKKD